MKVRNGLVSAQPVRNGTLLPKKYWIKEIKIRRTGKTIAEKKEYTNLLHCKK